MGVSFNIRWVLPISIVCLWELSSLRCAERPVATSTQPPDQHWAFRPVIRPAAPSVRCRERLRTPLDAFIGADLEKKGLTLGPEADRAVLLRRVCFDLTGLPPTPEEIKAFLSDTRPDAYERLIERCLASPRYGERWGKYWLDAAGYADSNGYFHADSDRPLAYRYRDYVIDAFNKDKPYDRFVFEQLAGDELAGYKPGGKITEATVEPLTATHFLRNAPDGTGESDGNPDELRIDRYTVLEGTLQNVASCLLGITIQCARCHSHKFEPIAQEEYYRLQAIFFAAYCPDRWLKPAQRVVAVADGSKPERKLSILFDSEAAPPVHHLLKRGSHNAPGQEVHPGVPTVFCSSSNVYRLEPRPSGQHGTGRRSAFARWVTSPQNPLFARVMVNRIWQYHFGVGIVATPDNLGKSGAKPTHPELLDYLAAEFIHSGWSIKVLHRRILRSAVYRQSSAARAEALAVDPNNRLLWRYPVRRLDAEALRDAMLAVSGELDASAGGPYVPTVRRADGDIVVDESKPGARRRSVYLRQRRSETATILALFDAPAMTGTCGVRAVSTVPLQSLALLNSDFTRARARAFSRRLDEEGGTTPEKRIMLAFQIAYGRPPDAAERAAVERFLAARRTIGGKSDEALIWSDFCHMLLAGNGFLYID